MTILKSLLIELRTEELPPNDLKNLAISFSNNIVNFLAKDNFIDSKDFEYYATPRRLSVIIKNVKYFQDNKIIIKKGPSKLIGIKNGKPTKALNGFIKSNKTTLEKLKIINDGKNDIFIYEYLHKGSLLKDKIDTIISNSIKSLLINKTMRWSNNNYYFVRPVHGLVIIHGENTIKTNILGLKSQNWTLGHRFLSKSKIVINNADQYTNILEKKGKVITSFEKRKNLILSKLNEQANKNNFKLHIDEKILDEVTALVEWPIILEAKFDKKFIEIPQECLITSMQKNQKYFYLTNNNLKLINTFLFVANIETTDYSYIINGNEKVLKSRFSDAKFFFEQDKKNKLISLLLKLKNIIYHNQVGSQFKRVQRLIKLSEYIANIIKADISLSKRTAQLSKCDLVTNMVSEFPELQGIMGKYYALNDKEHILVATAIEQHYWPKSAKDPIPEFKEAIAVALADKVEYLFAMYFVGIRPTGEKDPYALRRNALAIIRILLEYNIDLLDVLNFTKHLFNTKEITDNNIINKIYDFILTRLEIYLNQFFENKIIRSLLIKKPCKFNNLINKLKAISKFINLSESVELITTNKRIYKILKKSEFKNNIQININILQQKEEKELLNKINNLNEIIINKVNKQEYFNALNELLSINYVVNNFFDKIMVMTEDIKIKNNRLAILNKLYLLLNYIADFTLL